MSEEYEITIRKKNNSAEGAIGCLILILLIPIIGPCFFECDKKDSQESLPSTVAYSGEVVQQPVKAKLLRKSASVRCRTCRGDGKIDVWSICPICNGRCRIVDHTKTARNVKVDRLFNRRNNRLQVYYKNCPSCKGRGKLKQIDNCHECAGTGSIVR